MINLHFPTGTVIEEFSAHSQQQGEECKPYILKIVLQDGVVEVGSFPTTTARDKRKKAILGDFRYLWNAGINTPSADHMLALSALFWDYKFEKPTRADINTYVEMKKMGIV